MLSITLEGSTEPVSDRSTRRLERLKALLGMGGTMENNGISLHLGDLRMDVNSIADMSDEAWRGILASLEAPSAGSRH